jgi:hypothetical protein
MYGKTSWLITRQSLCVEVFTTTVTTHQDALAIIAFLTSALEGAHITFDLEDVDKVLRVASPKQVNCEWVVRAVRSFGFQAEEMADVVAEPVRFGM